MSYLYEPAAYTPDIWPESYWRASSPALPPCPTLTGPVTADVAIIGAGYAGLNAALELRERFGAEVVVLDAAAPGWGASGRNGGFCCLGGANLSPAQITRRVGALAAPEFDSYQQRAIDRVADNLARYGIDADRGPAGEVLLAHSARTWAAMQAQQGADGVQLWGRAALRDAGLNCATAWGGTYRPEGFPLHPLKYARGLAVAAQAAGVRIYGDSPVKTLDHANGLWSLRTGAAQVQARRVLIATNGYSDERLPRWLSRRILPALSTIIVTRPLSLAEREAQGWTSHLMTYDSRTMLHYFRLLPDGRFLFGARGGVSAQPERLARFTARARAEFEAMFPAFAQAETTHDWSGLVCLTGSMAPFCGPVPGAEGLFAALGWHGNGVAAASEGGRRIAPALMGLPDTTPALFKRPPPRFPLPRKLLLRAGMAAALWRDGPLRPAPEEA
ncbi:NAD(P)/FAD-dependent oxidoreductase [Roseicitreum antarcticum]|uniref:Glycine/D-amino acid oxidase n=1 Tax=Roseicitreum antarcticum TaxID=564137 RepID=A0A1H2W6H7_9RHOB|nr:FAD-dependent oxidoreductase [Roseicitreum antarcticum]SDW76131.1 Glycine/D-amino acid oxidase [Roseicitreum antarcticum]